MTAYREFFNIYFPRLYRFASYRLNGDATAAEDITQIALMKAFDNIQSYRGEAALYTWLCAISRREIGTLIRKESRNPIVLAEDAAISRAVLESMEDPHSSPPDDYRAIETVRLIRVVLDALPIAYGDALEWKYIDGLSVAQIGVRLDRSTKATESLLNRARSAFKEAFFSLSDRGSSELQEQSL